MCAVSVVSDYGSKLWGGYTPTVDWKEEYEKLKKQFDEFKALVAAAQKFDTATNQPACGDESKLKWMEEIEARIKFLEEKINVS